MITAPSTAAGGWSGRRPHRPDASTGPQTGLGVRRVARPSVGTVADETRQGPRAGGSRRRGGDGRWRCGGPPPGCSWCSRSGSSRRPSVAPAGTPVLVAARDLAPGVALGPADVGGAAAPGRAGAGRGARRAGRGRRASGGRRGPGRRGADRRPAAGPGRRRRRGRGARRRRACRCASPTRAWPRCSRPGRASTSWAAGADGAGRRRRPDPASSSPPARSCSPCSPRPSAPRARRPWWSSPSRAALAARVATASLREEVTVTLR